MKSKKSEPDRSLKKPENKNPAFEVRLHRIEIDKREIKLIDILFHHPETKNSFSSQIARDLARILKLHQAADALLFRSLGRVFCSGGNLKDYASMTVATSMQANRDITGVLKKINDLQIPTLALVEGDVFGGGIELISAFDFVFVTPHIQMGFWQRKMGLAFGWGGGARIAARLGPQAASKLGVEAKCLTGRQAYELGLVDRVLPPWAAQAEAFAEILRLASLPRGPVGAFKHARDPKLERVGFERLWMGAEHQEGLRRFREKREKQKKPKR